MIKSLIFHYSIPHMIPSSDLSLATLLVRAMHVQRAQAMRVHSQSHCWHMLRQPLRQWLSSTRVECHMELRPFYKILKKKFDFVEFQPKGKATRFSLKLNEVEVGEEIQLSSDVPLLFCPHTS